jgi:hypothetical protein
MTPNVKQGRRVTAWLGVACLGLLPVSFLLSQSLACKLFRGNALSAFLFFCFV